jgi:hypothetical protein
MTRVPEVWLDPQGRKSVYVELVDLAPDPTTGPRVQVPAPGRECVEWLKSAEKCDALIEISEPGCVKILPWQPYGEKILSRIQWLEENRPEDWVEEVLFLTERFRRIHVEKSGRFPVHQREQFHLGLSAASGWLVLLVCLPERIELWNEDFRRRWRGKAQFQLPWP